MDGARRNLRRACRNATDKSSTRESQNKEGFETALVSNLIRQIQAPINDAGFGKGFDPNDSPMVMLHHEIALPNGLIVFMNQ
jgi:hypothetical protein